MTLACALALLAWWGGTASVMWLASRPRAMHPAMLLRGAVVALLGLALVPLIARSATPAAACAGFLAAVTIWGWHELAFLTGRLTGPVRTACPPASRGWQRLRNAAGTVAWHEAALLATLGGLALATARTPDRTALHTFAALYVLRLCAKLNLYLGVRQTGAELLPAHLAYLASYFRMRAMNPLWPVTVITCGALAAWLVVTANDPDTNDHQRVSLTLIASFVGLGLLEHLFMMAPASLLRRWNRALGMRAADSPTTPPAG